MIHIIVYSVATGRVRRIVDPQENVPNVIAYLNQVTIAPGEARLVYNAAAGDLATQWQAAVNAHTGKSVQWGVDAGDTYAEVDSNNNILSVHVADPTCGDKGPNGGTLILAPAGCSTNWTYNGTTFTAPTLPVKPSG